MRFYYKNILIRVTFYCKRNSDAGQLIQLLDKVGDVGQLIQLLDKVGDVGQLIQLLDKVSDAGQLIQLLDKVSDSRELLQLLDRLMPDEILSSSPLSSQPQQLQNISIREPSLTITAKNPSPSEIRAANFMKNKGYNVELRDPVGTRAGGQTSDLLVNGVPYDVYTPTTKNASRIISAIAKKNSQTTGIVLDLSETTVTQRELGNILERVQRAGATNIKDIQIIGGQ